MGTELFSAGILERDGTRSFLIVYLITVPGLVLIHGDMSLAFCWVN